jgi:hypothetical protein
LDPNHQTGTESTDPLITCDIDLFDSKYIAWEGNYMYSNLWLEVELDSGGVKCNWATETMYSILILHTVNTYCILILHTAYTVHRSTGTPTKQTGLAFARRPGRPRLSSDDRIG